MKGLRVVAIAMLLAVGGVFVAPSRTLTQSGMLAVRATSDNLDVLRAWDSRVDQMVRSGELRRREPREDTLMPNRINERFDQTYSGIPVWGADIVRQSERGLTTSLFGSLRDGIVVETTPRLSAEQAKAVIAALTPGIEQGPKLPELFVLPLDGGGYALAYQGQSISPDGAYVYFVDAVDGSVRLKFNLFQNQSAVVTGVGVLGDQKKLSVCLQSGAYVADDLLRPPSLQTFDMRGNFTAALNALSGLTTLGVNDLASASSTNWSDGPDVDAHAYEGYTYDFYFKRFGRRGLDNLDGRIAGLVHPVRLQDVFSAPPSILGQYYINAFYCRTCGSDRKGLMVYGEGLPATAFLLVGTTRVFVKNFAAGLDVIAHELSHGVTAFSSGLLGSNEAGALNEAFSDMMGTSVEFYVRGPGQANYLILEDVVSPLVPGFQRSLADPLSLGTPDNYAIRLLDSLDNGEVHANSTIASHAFYLAIEGGTNRTSKLAVTGVGAVNRDQIEKVFYRGFTQFLPSNATFATARAATIQAARDLYGVGSAPERAVIQAWTAVGVN